MALAEDLEAIAGGENRPSSGGLQEHGIHHRAEARDGAGPQVVAVAEYAWKDHQVGAAEIAVAVPDEVAAHSRPLDAPEGVEVGVAAGEAYHRHVQHQPPSTSTR